MANILSKPVQFPLIAALGFGLTLGFAVIAVGPTMVLVGIMGLIILLLSFTNPEIVIIIFLCLVSGIVPARFIPNIRVVGYGFYVSDFILILLFLVLIFRLLAEKNFQLVKTHLDLPLLLFFCAVVMGILIAMVSHEIPFSYTTAQARTLLYYSIFFPVTNLLRTREQLHRLILGVLLIGSLVAGLLVIQAISGWSIYPTDSMIARGEGLLGSIIQDPS